MNIEDERKAFEEHCKAEKLAVFKFVRWDGAKYVSKASRHPYQQAMFEIWMAAKAHATGPGKPEVRVKKRPFKLPGFAVYLGRTYHRRLHISESIEDGVKWAIDNGYRVIEE